MGGKITDYNVIYGTNIVTNINEFLDEIEEAIKDGWQPFGSPVLKFDYRCQAMVKYEAVES